MKTRSKKRLMPAAATIVLVLCAVFLMTGCDALARSRGVWPPRGWKQSDYGSFSPDTTYSFDGRYYAVQTLTRPADKNVDYILVTVYESATEEAADSFLTERAMDF